MRYKFSMLFFAVLFINFSCDPDDPAPVNEEELITTLTFTLVPKDGGTTVVLSFKDLDGDGGNAPIITGGKLLKEKEYTGTIQLLNESKSPAEDITTEVKNEGADHQFFFATTVELQNAFEYAYNDTDKNGKPIGVSTLFKTLTPGKGTFQITLRHLPNKSGARVSEGDITNAGGETDIEVDFPLEIE